MECGTPQGSGSATLSVGCNDWDDYGITDAMTGNTPIKTIRVTVHIFQKNDGSGNFANANWVSGAVNDCNNIWGNLNPMTTPTNSPYYQDSRVRVQIVGTYVWQNTTMWGLSNWHASSADGQQMYNFVMGQASVQNKATSIHLLFPGEPQTNPEGVIKEGGRVPGIGDKRWAMFANVHHLHQLDPINYWPRGVILHELGHNLGLLHAWPGDICLDTPTGTQYKDSLGRNIMDYNTNQTALTRCQISEMHWHILHDEGDLRDVVSQTINPNNPSISGYDCVPYYGTAYSPSNYQWGTELSWSVSPSSRVTTATGCGFPAQLTPSGAPGTATLSYTSDWGTNGTRSANKSLNVNVEIVGTVFYSGLSQPLDQLNLIPSNQMEAVISATGISSFSWAKTAGSGSYNVYNSGKNNNMNIPNSNSLSFTISSNSSACPISRNVTFVSTSGSFSVFPNPVEDELIVKASEAYEIVYPKPVDNSQAPADVAEKSTHTQTQTLTLDPSIEQINIIDLEGNELRKMKTNNKSKVEKLNVSELRPGTCIVELLNGDLNIPKKARTLTTKIVKQ